MSFHKTNQVKNTKKSNDKEERSLCRFIWYRISGIKSLTWIFGLLFLLLYVLCRLKEINLTCLQEYLNNIIRYLNAHKTAIDGWTYSYIAGALVYYLTVVFPGAKRSQALLPIVCERVRYINDSFFELSNTLCGDNWCINKESIENGVKQVMTFGKTKSDNHYTFEYCFMLSYFISEIDKYTDMILQLYEVLPSKYLKRILDVKYSSTFDKIRTGELDGAVFDEYGIRQFLEQLRQENIKMNKLYKQIFKRVYKSDHDD